ncbi:MAG: hypothetical protein WB680_23145 [Candidatus Acidiferrales bacterium]
MPQFLIVVLTAVLSFAAPLQPPKTISYNDTPFSPSLQLYGPNLVQTADEMQFRAFLINDSKQSVEVPSPQSMRGIIYLEWRVVDVSTNAVKTRWAGFTLCTSGKKFTQQDFLVLKPGQRVELPDIQIPDGLVGSERRGSYRISIRYAFPVPNTVLLPDDILRSNRHFDINSNELTVLFAE